MVLSDNFFPPDIRVEKEAKTLIDNGHEVHLLAIGKAEQQREEMVNNIHVHGVNPPFYNKPMIGYFFYFFHFRYWLAFKIERMIKKYSYEALHVHDLPFAMATMIAGMHCDVPVIFDMHEHYVEMMRSNFEVQGRSVPLLPSLLAFEEKSVCKNVHKVVVVVGEQRERIAKLYGIPKEKIEVISNTADISLLSQFESEQNARKSREKWTVSYVGGFSKHRGIDVLINAIPRMLEKHKNVHLVLVGEDPFRKRLEGLVRSLGIQEHVTFTGWVPFEKAMGHVKGSDICVIPYHNTPHTATTVPHKLFQYMFFKKPVLGADVMPLKRIITETMCGLVFKAGDSKDLAEKLVHMVDDEEGIEEMGRNGHRAVIEKYNWDNEGGKLLKLYESIKEGPLEDA
jgi:glycosyltransferase involved in cell wall biosynthesis